jgi:type IV secretion system protein VirB2
MRKKTDFKADARLLKKPSSLSIKNFISEKLHYLAWSMVLVCLTPAFATSTDLPWEGPMNKILASVTGPVAQFLGVIAIIISGFGIAFGEAGSGLRRLFQVVLGLSIAFTATSLLSSVFGVTSGAVF